MEYKKPLKINIEEVKYTNEIYKTSFNRKLKFTKIDVFHSLSNKFGWSHNEYTHIWSTTKKLILPLYYIPNDNNTLYLKMRAYLDNYCSKQSVIFYHKGRKIHQAYFFDDNIQDVEINIPKDWFENDFIELKLELLDKPSSPAYSGLQDNRFLGIALSDIYINEQNYEQTLRKGKFFRLISNKHGWSGNEGTHIWSIDRELTLPIYHTPKEDINKLVLKLSAYLDNICPEQNIIISSNSKELIKVKFDSAKNEQVVEIDIPKELFKDSFIELKIDLLNEVSTPANNGSGDSRTLGIALSDIYFK